MGSRKHTHNIITGAWYWIDCDSLQVLGKVTGESWCAEEGYWLFTLVDTEGTVLEVPEFDLAQLGSEELADLMTAAQKRLRRERKRLRKEIKTLHTRVQGLLVEEEKLCRTLQVLRVLKVGEPPVTPGAPQSSD